MLHTKKLVSLSLAAAGLAATAEAQTPQIVLRTGQLVLGGGGNVKSIQKIAVSDGGIFFVHAQTTNPDRALDDVLLLNGFLSVQESAEVAQPQGAIIQSFDDLDVNAKGFVGWPLNLDTGSNSDDEGIYWNTLLLSQENTPLRMATEVWGTPIEPGSTYQKFRFAKINDRDSIMWTGNIREGGQTKNALVLLKTDGAGNLLEETILAMKDHPYPGAVENIKGVGSDNPNLFSLNNRDEYIAEVAFDAPLTDDSAIVANGVVLAREGQESPVPGYTYSDLGATKVDINDFGDVLWVGYLNAPNGSTVDNLILAVNGEVFVQKNRSYPSIAPERLDRFESVTHFITNSGDVFWYCNSNGNGADNQYLIRNQQTIIREGHTQIDGELIDTMNVLAYAWHVSRSGRFMVTEVGLATGQDVVVLADFGTLYPLNGCAGNPGTLTKLDGDARLGERIQLEMDGGQSLGALPILYWTLNNAARDLSLSTIQCGTMLGVGEVMVSLSRADFLGRQTFSPYDGNPVEVEIDVPMDPNLVNLKVYGQGIFFDPSASGATPTFQLTNGFYIEVGAP